MIEGTQKNHHTETVVLLTSNICFQSDQHRTDRSLQGTMIKKNMPIVEMSTKKNNFLISQLKRMMWYSKEPSQ